MSGYQSVFERKEVKFLLSDEQYTELKRRLAGIAKEDAYGETPIYNIYYDTPYWELARRSIESPQYKEKLRVRSYGIPADTSKIFIEIKKKYKGIVYKRRICAPYYAAAAYLSYGQPIRFERDDSSMQDSEDFIKENENAADKQEKENLSDKNKYGANLQNREKLSRENENTADRQEKENLSDKNKYGAKLQEGEKLSGENENAADRQEKENLSDKNKSSANLQEREKLSRGIENTAAGQEKENLSDKNKYNANLQEREKLSGENENTAAGQSKEYLPDKKKCSAGEQEQILREIDRFLQFYENIQPAMAIAYDRIALVGIDDPGLRITFDRNIRWSTDDLDMRQGAEGALVIAPDQHLMEIKISGSLDIRIAHLLSELGIYQTSFSKYGHAFLQYEAAQRQAGNDILAQAKEREKSMAGKSGIFIHRIKDPAARHYMDEIADDGRVSA